MTDNKPIVTTRNRNRLAVASEDLPDWLAERIEVTRMDTRHDTLNEDTR